MFKYEIGQKVFYLCNNKLCSGEVISRSHVENCKGYEKKMSYDSVVTDKFYMPFGEAGTFYKVCEGIFTEEDLYATIEDFKASFDKYKEE